MRRPILLTLAAAASVSCSVLAGLGSYAGSMVGADAGGVDGGDGAPMDVDASRGADAAATGQ